MGGRSRELSTKIRRVTCPERAQDRIKGETDGVECAILLTTKNKGGRGVFCVTRCHSILKGDKRFGGDDLIKSNPLTLSTIGR